MIRIKSGMDPIYDKKAAKNENGENRTEMKVQCNESVDKTPVKNDVIDSKKSPTKEKLSKKANLNKKFSSNEVVLNNENKNTSSTSEKKKTEVRSKDLPAIERQINTPSEANVAWTEKYKPKDLKSIIGQQGEKSNMNKLLNWLKNWSKYHSGKNKAKVARPSPWAKDDDGAFYKCALLSGPPGVGKLFYFSLFWIDF